MIYLILSVITVCSITISTIVTQSRGWGLIVWGASIMITIGCHIYEKIISHNTNNNWWRYGIIMGVGIITFVRLWNYDVHCRNTPSIITGAAQVTSIRKLQESYLITQKGSNYQWIYPSTQILNLGDQIMLYASVQPITYCITTHTHRNLGIRKIITRFRGGNFDYNVWLAMKGINGSVEGKGIIVQSTHSTSTITSYLNTTKQRIISTIATLFHNKRTVGRVGGSLIGDKTHIQKSDYDLLINSGLVHLIVVSGGNLALVILLLSIVLFWAPITLRSILIIIGLLLYVGMVGFDSSVVRSLIMALITIAGTLLGRKWSFGGMISIALLLLLRYNPLIMYDVGLRLSLGAVIGIYITYQWTTQLTIQRSQQRYIKQSRQILLIISASIGARLGTLPVLIWQFGSANLTSVVANSITGIIASITIIIELITIGLYSIAPYFIGVQWMVQATDYLVGLIYRIVKLTVERGVWIGVGDQSGFWIISGSIMAIFVLLYRHTRKMRIEYLLEIEEEF